MQQTSFAASAVPAGISPQAVTLNVRQGHLPGKDFIMRGPVLLIGRAPFCDIRLAQSDIPPVHSELHCDGGVLWIEAANLGQQLEINGRNYVRLALRNGDRIQIGGHELAVMIDDGKDLDRATREFAESLEDLSANELCDLILAEEEELESHEIRRRDGWRKLLSAVEASLEELPTPPESDYLPGTTNPSMADWNLNTFEEFSEPALNLEPDLQEASLTTNTPLEAMTARIDELLLQFSDGELRASA